jgi:hypothetical protein
MRSSAGALGTQQQLYG